LADLDCAEFAAGLQFFEMNDCIPLLIGPSGEAFANDTDYVIVVTSTLDGFLERLMADPGFYIPLLGED
jgi:hypothetical protein